MRERDVKKKSIELVNFVFSSPTKGGSKLEMLAGVKSQMSGWLSGGIPGLSGRGAAETAEGGEQISSAETTENQTSRDIVQGTAPDNVKDDDASRWVAGYVDSVTTHADGSKSSSTRCLVRISRWSNDK